MTARSQSSRPPRAAFTAAGGTPNTGRVGAPAPDGDTPPARPGQICGTCDHLDVLHDISKTTGRRTACSVSSGPKATRCGCRAFEAAPEPLNQENPS